MSNNSDVEKLKEIINTSLIVLGDYEDTYTIDEDSFNGMIDEIITKMIKPSESDKVVDAIKEVVSLEDYIHSIHDKIPNHVRINLYGLANNIRIEIHKILKGYSK